MTSSMPSLNISTTASYTGNITEDSSMGEGATFKALKLLLYAVIFVISVVGNTLVCAVIAKRRQMRTVTNCFILNLAIADLAMTCICIPFDIPVQENNYNWPYGSFVCKLLYPLQTMSMFASIFTLTVLSLNRYRAILHPLRRQMDIHHVKVVVVFIWILSLLLTIPYIVVLQLNETNDECEEIWPSKKIRKVYTASLFVFQYLLPLIVITFTYVQISMELARRLGARNTAVNSNLAFGGQYQSETRRVVRMLIVVTLLFAVCVLPNNIVWLWLDFGRGQDYKHIRDLIILTNIALFANSAANPIAYTICHENFREHFKLCFTCKPTASYSSGNTTSLTRNWFKSFSDATRSRLAMQSRYPGKTDKSTVCPKETDV